jgi:hypothetical protein
VSVLGGTQLQFYPGIAGMSGAERAGMHFSFGGGRWFNDYLGLRFSASYSRNNWIKYGSDNLKSTRYSSLRLEGMLDIFNLCRRIYGSNYDDSYGSVPFFGLSLLAGPEMGHMLKHKYTGAFSDHYVGAVGGLQARSVSISSFLCSRNLVLLSYRTAYTPVQPEVETESMDS